MPSVSATVPAVPGVDPNSCTPRTKVSPVVSAELATTASEVSDAYVTVEVSYIWLIPDGTVVVVVAAVVVVVAAVVVVVGGTVVVVVVDDVVVVGAVVVVVVGAVVVVVPPVVVVVPTGAGH